MDFDIDEMIMAGKAPAQDELLPPEFRERFGLPKVHQLGLVVPSVTEAATRLEEVGIGPFFIAEDDLCFWIEGGENKFFHGKMGLAHLGGYELELLEAGIGSSFYSDGFRKDGKIALHHVGLLDHGIDALVKKMRDADIGTAVRGKIKMGPLTTDFEYMDTRDELEMYVELIDWRFAGIGIRPSASLLRVAARALKLFGVKELKMGKGD